MTLDRHSSCRSTFGALRRPVLFRSAIAELHRYEDGERMAAREQAMSTSLGIDMRAVEALLDAWADE
jgi:hypothetical protein